MLFNHTLSYKLVQNFRKNIFPCKNFNCNKLQKKRRRYESVLYLYKEKKTRTIFWAYILLLLAQGSVYTWDNSKLEKEE